jgi:PAS domain S-box-containing protein
MVNLVGDPQVASRPEPGGRSGQAAEIDYRRFFELSLEILATAGFDGYLSVVNPAFEALLGRSAEELTGRPYVDFVHPDDVASTLTEAAKLAAGIDTIAFENRYRCKDGSYRWIRWSVKVDIAAETLYYAGLDVTEKLAQREALDELVTELERSNADLSQFAYVASHDLSEPLRMVSSYVQLLADRYSGQLDADADEFISYAVDGAARMKVLIDDLLTYSKAGRVAPVHRSVDCAAVMRGVMSDLSSVVSDADATVVIGELPVLTSDPGLLTQVFQNLLANALKFVSPGVSPVVTVTAEHGGSEWQFTVKDNGIGIADEHRERIFMMFKRLHARSEYPGTGIGLALCQKIVSRLEGRLWVESEPGCGATFHFTVPDAAPAAAEGPSGPSERDMEVG